ncbi:hypothetical protein R69888_02928 [Paraburkholderia haematera]|uniref:Uncharacterized protein n=1 Tax=Paraburkholderia haematera TaxID=2793077 RepID=A0ABN7LH37_9BURK|nr:hypothetical protein R69888_02928 [Paraburkholderia haematera]
MRTRMHVGFMKEVMPGSGAFLAGAFPACAVMDSEVFNN